MSASDYLEAQIRAHIFRSDTFTKPTALYVALFTSDPTDTGDTSGEVSGGSYARVACNPDDANWTAASATDGVTTNANDITFPTATASWGTITHWGILDASTAGNMIVSDAVTTSKSVSTGDTFKFPAGQLSVTVS